RSRKRLRIGVAAITPILLRLPGMTADGQAQAAKFTEHDCSFFFRFRGAWARIFMHVIDVAYAAIGPAAGVINQTRWVEFTDLFYDVRGFPLAPAFVEWHPHDDAGMIAAALDQAAQFRPKFLRRFGRTLDVLVSGSDVFVSAGHILPDQQTKPITPII